MKSHRTDGVSFTFGVIFLAIAAWYLVAQTINVDLPRVGWVLAGGLILLGLLGLISGLRSSRAAEAPTDESPLSSSTSPAKPETSFQDTTYSIPLTSDRPTSDPPATDPLTSDPLTTDRPHE